MKLRDIEERLRILDTMPSMESQLARPVLADARILLAWLQEAIAALEWAQLELGDHSGGCDCKICTVLSKLRDE